MNKATYAFVAIITVVMLLLVFVSFRDKKNTSLIDILKSKQPTVTPFVGDPSVKNLGNHKDVILISDIPGKEVKLIAPIFLAEQLEKMGFWDPSGSNFYNDNGEIQNRTTVQSIEIHLTNIQQPISPFLDDNGIPYQSFGTKFDTSRKQMKLYINVKSERDMSELETQYSSMILYSLYTITHRFTKGSNVAEEYSGLNEYIEKLNQLPSKTFVDL